MIIKTSFFRKIILPAFLAILLFVVFVFAFIIPEFERSVFAQKKNMLHELTNTAWSILQKNSTDQEQGLVSKEEAMSKAIAEIEALRYGYDKKDYFWITDLTPTMIMHPYVHELTGKSLQDFADPDGKKIFIEALHIAQSTRRRFYQLHNGSIKDDSAHIVPKLSFVKI
jgi:signal transduction histidine kinase